MRLSSSQTWLIVGLASLIWLALSVVGVAQGGGIAIVLTFADVIPGLLFVGFVYERWLWRWAPLHAIGLLATPVVIGTWRGNLESLWDKHGTRERLPAKTVYLAINQTLTTIMVRQLTDESESVQMSGSVTRDDAGFPVIAYSYRNTPHLRARVDNPSPIHHGAALLKIIGDPATALEGSYWTDRGTAGQLAFREHSPEVAQSFGQATALTYGVPRPLGATDGRLRKLLKSK